MAETTTPAAQRILGQRHCTAMVALDTIGPIAERVRNLLSHGRRISISRRYTYLPHPPELTVGLTVEEVRDWSRDGAAGIGVSLRPGLTVGFGLAAYPGESDTERQVRDRFHASDEHRDVTEVRITGGLPGDGPARDDRLVIRHWNANGVCDERVVAFDYGDGRG